ncbi:hypothetical protein HCN44_009294 [Aphidius gifuensis]|uniref:Phospholipid-transporting ATPase n=1 Tax=Aphidius gifuensis TaxID=684658 RepID=A0A834Y4F8_APHGI|nr:hypothetical protein HCN44_009294 [Aphidius gifuensis]
MYLLNLFFCHALIISSGRSNASNFLEHRIFTIDPQNDPANTVFPRNRIKTNKYTLWNFIPKNLYEQFRRIANFYFLISALIALSIDSPVSPLTTFLPLIFVILVTAGKQAYEDFLRHCLDNKVNRMNVTVIRNKCTRTIYCEEIVVGDLVKVSRDEDIPCDIIILHTSEINGCCYVTTTNLDGETNLKTLQVPKVTMGKISKEIVGMKATVTCQHPRANLYEFYGKIEVQYTDDFSTGSLSIDNIILRGSRLKDTEFIIGTAVYTGRDTKLSLNSKFNPNKFSTAEKSINKSIIFFIFVLIMEIFISTIIKQLIYLINKPSWYLGINGSPTFFKILKDILNFTVLYNYIVPISLYVTVELQRFMGSFFFRWDLDMYDETNDLSALVNTSDLNEELGQIEYLFTDKTGTLTENLMIFRRCSIDGKIYMEKNCNGKLYLLPDDGNEKNSEKLTNWPSELWHFLMAISLCHSVHVAPPILMDSIALKRAAFRASFRQRSITRVNSSLLMHPDLPEYQAASADEKALVEATARCGVILTNNSGENIEIQVGEEIISFTRLEMLEFTSERKRMSVILQDDAGDVWLYTKGADSVMLPLIADGKLEESKAHLADFSKRGLRTLVVAFKKLKIQDYNTFSRSIEHVRQIVGPNRSINVSKVYNTIENKLHLLGITAVEDRLQENVEETLESLRQAGIKTWILTGDKAETAENISFSCGHFKNGTEILRLMNITTLQICYITLTSFERKLKLESYKQYGLMIDGTSMTIAYKNCPELLRIVAMTCESVVGCRMSPLQKSELVQLIKSSENKPLTAAIGDGGNDVSMIQEAHVGIGIMGREGRQATMSADFALAKFMHLEKAILVHGHWYYIRITTLTHYFFYKNIVFITPQFLFGLNSIFSTQALYTSVFLMGFNVLFTSLPVLMFGLLEQDYKSNELLRYPKLYQLNKRNYLMSTFHRISWLFTAIWHTFVIYFGTYTFWLMNPVNLNDGNAAGYYCYNTCIFHLIVIVTNMELLVRSSFWTIPFLASIFLSILSFFIVAIFYSSIDLSQHVKHHDMYWVANKLFSSVSFWLLTIVIVFLCLIPDIMIIIYNRSRPVKLNYLDQKDILIKDTYSEWSVPSTQSKFCRLTPWRNHFCWRKSR